VGASDENPEESSRRGGGTERVDEGVCPQCGFVRRDLPREPSYGGDRILVNKFAYQLGEPQRWDVIVFRFPGDAKMNYIKRLIGLPNEAIEIFGGDIYAGANPVDGAPLAIARKPHRKLRAMLQHVDDNHHIPKTLNDAGWPRRWQADFENPPDVLEEILDESHFSADSHEGTRLVQRWKSSGLHPNQMAFIDFRDYIADENAWRQALRHVSDGRDGLVWRPDEMIGVDEVKDFYSYNTNNQRHRRQPEPKQLNNRDFWVGDLAVECEIDVEEARGEFELALEEGGFQFRALFDLEDGGVTLEIVDHANADAMVPFGDDGKAAKQPQAKGVLGKSGKHKLMLANCDDKLYVWVDDKPVQFDGPTEYAPLGNWKSKKSDVTPAHVGVRGFKGSIDHIRLMRDVYYTPMRKLQADDRPRPIPIREDEYGNPSVVFQTGADQFFALGDNSPSSQDGRIWTDGNPGTPHVVDRRLLIGKALFIYWPYGQLLPRWPLFERMKLIR
jgi:signal peptidase I